MSVTVSDVYTAIDGFAPYALAEPWDNPGILAGRKDRKVDTVLCALDLNEGVLREAAELGADLIVTHHPILFRGRKNLCEDEAEARILCALIRAEIALIAAHTNFDNAQPGVNDAQAKALGLKDVCACEGGLRVGSIAEMPLGEFTRLVEEKLGGPVRRYGEEDRNIRRVALLGGAGADYAQAALAAGADVFITGEIAHHRAWEAYESGLCVLEAGHAATELPGVALLTELLVKALPADIKVIESRTRLFR